MIWNPLSLLQAIFPASAKSEMAAMSDRWQAAAKADPVLVEDLIWLGDVIVAQPTYLENGIPRAALPDPQALAYAAGRRDMALQVLALMNLTPSQTYALMKES